MEEGLGPRRQHLDRGAAGAPKARFGVLSRASRAGGGALVRLDALGSHLAGSIPAPSTITVQLDAQRA